ncbi:MAG: histidine phosphatase family protein [bacterium]|nr:histidine phosphatase family protein [bacterium]
MKLLFVRHGDPDYTIDSLTEKGWREAEIVSHRIEKLDVKDFYVSPLGRAKDTASFTLKAMNRTATECEWLREFAPRIHRPDKEGLSIVWDWLPDEWTSKEEYYDPACWADTEIMREGSVREEYEWVTGEFDALLSQHGYTRENQYYRVGQANHDTLVFFCHFGVQCVLLSHLLGITPMVLWHGACAAPASVTTVVSEERRKGIASFRITAFGDTSHFYEAGEPLSLSARFCEEYDNAAERHD